MPKNGVVCSPKPHHLKGEHLLAEIGCRAEADGQVDLALLDLLPGATPWNGNLLGWSLSKPIPMSSKVCAYKMLRLLPSSMST